jgi:dolichyl-phosphate-mannose--protein O-mannosyl transferase
MSAYVWDVWKDRLETQKEQGMDGVAIVVYFAVATGFAFTMFPVLLGLKDREESVHHKSMEM